MEVISKIKPFVAFSDMEIGDCFKDDYGNICIKTEYDCAIYYDLTDKTWSPLDCSDYFFDKVFETVNAKLVIE